MKPVGIIIACILGGFILFAAIGGASYQMNKGTINSQDKQECARIMAEDIRRSQNRDDAEAIIRSDAKAQEACRGFEMNGVPIVK